MRKEQIFVLVCALLAALVIWSNVGQYEPVGVEGPWNGKDMNVKQNVPYDVLFGLKSDAQGSRAFTREYRVEERPPLPEIPPPSARPLDWSPPPPSPGPAPAYMGTMREKIKAQKRAAASTDDSGAGDENADDDDDDDEPLDPFEATRKKKNWDPDKAARFVWSDGSEDLCELVPPDGKEVWAILEEWGKIDFHVSFKNQKDGSERSALDFGPSHDNMERVVTVHLKKTLINEINERRVREKVGATDRAALLEHARWIVDNLEPTYKVAALREAVKVYETAYALGSDLALVEELGALYRRAYNLDGELALYQRFLASKSENQKARALVAGALMDRGALGPAAALYEEAAVSGDPEIVIGLAECHFAQGNLTKAGVQFNKVKSGGDPLLRSHAFEGLARIALREGRFKEALTLARSAVDASSSSPDANNTLGSAHYCVGEYAEAERRFGMADGVWGDGNTRARSNKGFAMLQQGKLEEAEAAFQSCLDVDPLNYFDPLAGMAVVHQYYGELTESNDTLALALTRDPTNAWALQRLAKARLRDGAGKEGMELAKKALGIAPSSVGALQVVGLAAGSAGDHATAVKYLGRASRKRPRDMDLVYDHSRALIMNGQANQAAGILAKVTNTNGGLGSQDPKLLSLAAYALFLNKGDIPEVLRRISSALIKNPTDTEQRWLNAARDEIVNWNNSRIWTDSFNRQATQGVENGWDEGETVGPKISLGGSSVQISNSIGSEGGPERKGTTLLRTEELKKLVSVETAIKVGRGDEVMFHVYKGELPERAMESEDKKKKRRVRGGELGLGVMRDGTMVVFYTDGKDRQAPQKEITLKDAEGKDRKWPTDGEFHTIRLLRTDNRKGIFSIFFDGEEITAEGVEAWEVSQLSAAAQQCRVGFLIDGDVGHTVNVEIDYVQIRRKLQ